MALPAQRADTAVLYMGHGSEHQANSAYALMEYAFHDLGRKDVVIGTVEGYPGFGEALRRLKERPQVRRVELRPLMTVAGDHAKNDLAGDEEDSWRRRLEAEGYLPVGWAAGWGVVCVPFVVAGFLSIQKKVAQAPKAKILLAMCGAFAFVLSALKIPSITGSCSHPTGVGLGAILFGPMTMAVLGLIVLLFQALLLAHGGLTTLGANTFSMAIAGPIVSWAVYKLLRKANAPAAVAVFAAAALGDLFTYVVTSVQLGVVNGGIGKFLMVFAVTQIPLAIAEGLLTVVVFNVLEKYSREELHALCVL